MTVTGETVCAEPADSVAESEAPPGPETVTVETLYGGDAQVAALAERVMMLAPSVHYKLRGEWHTITKAEVNLVIRRSMALGLDPSTTRTSTSGGASTA